MVRQEGPHILGDILTDFYNSVWSRNTIHFQRRELLRQHVAQVVAVKAYLELSQSDSLREEASGRESCVVSTDTDSPSCVSSIDDYLVLKDPGREECLTTAYTQRRVENGEQLFLVNSSTTIAGYVMEALVMVRAKEGYIDLEGRLKDDSPDAEPICTVLCHTTTFMELESEDSESDDDS